MMNTLTKISAVALASALTVPAAAADFTVNGAGFGIPDNGSAASDIVVAANQTIQSLTVTLDMQHTWVGDLRAILSNGATTVTLFDRPGTTDVCCGNNMNLMGSYVFDDSASSPFPELSAGTLAVIPSGSFLPEGSLSDFAGSSTAGTWTLSISDNAGADIGSVNNWSIAFTTGSAVPEPGTWMLMLLGFFAIGATMRRRQEQSVRVSYS